MILEPRKTESGRSLPPLKKTSRLQKKNVIKRTRKKLFPQAFFKDYWPLILGMAVFLIVAGYLFLPTTGGFLPSPQFFSRINSDINYLPASSASGTCSGNSCVYCEPEHASCDGCTSNADCGAVSCTPTCDGWSGCSVSCGGGTQLRTCTAADCSTYSEEQACNTQACPPPICEQDRKSVV